MITEEQVRTQMTGNVIVNCMSSDRHHIHLSVEEGPYITGEGKKNDPSITAMCSCGASISGLKDAAAVFAIIQEHCRPL